MHMLIICATTCLHTDQEVLKAPVSSDKFLIQAYVLAEKVKDLTALWKNMPANAVQESVYVSTFVLL